ncbi:recombinase family protein, partial [Bacteroides acidifaciens]
MNVIIYCRVSSDEQTLGASLDVQEERLRKHCNQMRVCRNDASSFLYKQSPDFPKPGLCH